MWAPIALPTAPLLPRAAPAARPSATRRDRAPLLASTMLGRGAPRGASARPWPARTLLAAGLAACALTFAATSLLNRAALDRQAGAVRAALGGRAEGNDAPRARRAGRAAPAAKCAPMEHTE